MNIEMISLVQKLPKYNHNAVVFTINLHKYSEINYISIYH